MANRIKRVAITLSNPEQRILLVTAIESVWHDIKQMESVEYVNFSGNQPHLVVISALYDFDEVKREIEALNEVGVPAYFL